MCNGQHQNVFGHCSSLWKKDKQGKKKEAKEQKYKDPQLI
jgi:hypothetical protein